MLCERLITETKIKLVKQIACTQKKERRMYPSLLINYNNICST